MISQSKDIRWLDGEKNKHLSKYTLPESEGIKNIYIPWKWKWKENWGSNTYIKQNAL